MKDEELEAELLALVAAGRPGRLIETALGPVPDDVKEKLRATSEAFAAIAAAEAPAFPSPQVRDRVLATLKAKARPTKRALLVIDMLNDHLTPGRPMEVPRARDIVPALQKRLADARKEGVPVVYVCDEHDPDDTDLDIWSTHNVRGSQGAEVWPAIAPAAGDRVVKKPSYSAFTHSDLADVLAELGVDTLVLTGCVTEIGIMATATDALQRGYAIEVPKDAQAGANAQAEEVTLGVLNVLAPYGPARDQLLARLAA